MAKCPKCKQEIEYLNYYQRGDDLFEFSYDERNNIEDYRYKEFIPDCCTNDFKCPECKERLFSDENNALKFLKKVG